MVPIKFIGNYQKRICIYIEKCVRRGLKRPNFNLSKYLNLLNSNKGLGNTIFNLGHAFAECSNHFHKLHLNIVPIINNYTGTQSFITKLSYSMAQKHLDTLVEF